MEDFELVEDFDNPRVVTMPKPKPKPKLKPAAPIVSTLAASTGHAVVQSSKSSVVAPSFSSSVIESGRKDGYWVETIHFDDKDPVPGIITSGLVSGLIEFLDNPLAEADYLRRAACSCCYKPVEAPSLEKEWTKYEIGKFDSPVAVVAVDITQNGLMDLVVCHDYGPFMLECNPHGGHVTWLENPGRGSLKDGHWKERYIGRWPAMHRMKAGYFTQKSFLEVVAASVVRGPHDKTTPIPIIRFQAPQYPLEASEWHADIIDDENFTVIHEVVVKKCDGETGLDSLLVATREGTTLLRYKNKKWQRDLITNGEPKEPRQSPTSESPGSGDHWGSGGCDFGKIGDDPFAYCATLDPFHGISACVLTKENRGIDTQVWKRHVLDTYGTPNQRLKTGDGPGHYIVCADLDGDGDDEILLSLFGPVDRDENGESIPPTAGPHPYKGIMYYKPIDLKNGIFAKWKIAEESSARLALGDFAGKGVTDLVSVKYNVQRYYEEPNPEVLLYQNKFASAKSVKENPAIIPTLWDNEGMIYLRDPSTDSMVTHKSSMDLIAVADYLITIEVYPKKEPVSIPAGEGIKVIYGAVNYFDEPNSFDPKANPKPKPKETRSPFSVSPFTAASLSASEGYAYADEKAGAILLRYKFIGKGTTWSKAADVPVEMKLDLSSTGVTLPPLSFKKVDTLWWGKDNEFFKGVEFYNMTGFHFTLLDSKKSIAHAQFWTAGENVNCGVHNHSDNIFSEIHVSLSAGTKNGGMARLKSDCEIPPNQDLNKLGPEWFDQLVLKPMEEHGGMWERDTYGNAVRAQNNVVKYPWHKWQAGDGGSDIDVWMALEFNPDL